MILPPNKAVGFTVKYNGITNAVPTPVDVSEAYDPLSGGKEPPWSRFECIWDTGATNSCITARVASTQNLKPTGQTYSLTAGGKVLCNTYLINIRLPNGVAISAVRVTEAVLSGKTDVLIGMDIISRGDFAITNYHGQTWMSFKIPSTSPIDFLPEVNAYNKANLSEEEKRKARNKAKAERKQWR
jgi:hypothetical protein